MQLSRTHRPRFFKPDPVRQSCIVGSNERTGDSPVPGENMAFRRTQSGLSRRGLLKGLALGSGALLAGGWVAARLTDGDPQARLPEDILGAPEQQMLAVLADAVLHDVLPENPAARELWLDRVVAGCALGVAVLTPRLQRETHELISALARAPLRLLVIGQWAGWRDQSREQVQQRLKALQASENPTHRIVYRALRDLIVGAYYSDRYSWTGLGYEGPIVDLQANG